MHGTARLSDGLVRWSAEGVESLGGFVQLDGGMCSASLAAAAVEWLYCKPADGQPIVPSAESIAFDRIACWFHFDEQGLTVWGGDTPENTRSCILETRNGKPWLREPEYENVFAGRWVDFLLPANGSWLPGSREAVDTANRLPLPKGRKPTILK